MSLGCNAFYVLMLFTAVIAPQCFSINSQLTCVTCHIKEEARTASGLFH